MAIDPRILLIVAAIYGAVWVGGKAVDGVHKARVKVEHVAATGAKKIGHGLKHLVGK
jgi:hypothetical protein